MVRLKARLLKGGLLEIIGLEQFLDQRIAAMKRALGFSRASTPQATASSPAVARSTVLKSASRKAGPRAKPAQAKPGKKAKDPLKVVLKVLKNHPERDRFLRAGAQKDQLLRSLIPLYLGKDSGVEVTSGTISAFWKKQGIKFAAPNAAKALREHVGYARDTKHGKQLTPNGLKYVETALHQKKAA